MDPNHNGPWAAVGEFFGGLVVGIVAAGSVVIAWLKRGGRVQTENGTDAAADGTRKARCSFDDERLSERFARLEERLVEVLDRMEQSRHQSNSEFRQLMSRQTEILAGIAAEVRVRRPT